MCGVRGAHLYTTVQPISYFYVSIIVKSYCYLMGLNLVLENYDSTNL